MDSSIIKVFLQYEVLCYVIWWPCIPRKVQENTDFMFNSLSVAHVRIQCVIKKTYECMYICNNIIILMYLFFWASDVLPPPPGCTDNAEWRDLGIRSLLGCRKSASCYFQQIFSMYYVSWLKSLLRLKMTVSAVRKPSGLNTMDGISYSRVLWQW